MTDPAITEDKPKVFDGENADNLRAAAKEVTGSRQPAPFPAPRS